MRGPEVPTATPGREDPAQAANPNTIRTSAADNKVFILLVTVSYAFIDLLIVGYSKRNSKRSVDNWFRSLAMVDLEPLYPVPRVLAEPPIDNASIVPTIA